jgi:hypothetical protein
MNSHPTLTLAVPLILKGLSFRPGLLFKRCLSITVFSTVFSEIARDDMKKRKGKGKTAQE